MSYAIKIIGRPGKPDDFLGFEGEYIEEFDFEYENGLGLGTTTKDIQKAKPFDSMSDAAAFWQTQSKVRPIRWDGKPNRPLTATTVEIVEIPRSEI